MRTVNLPSTEYLRACFSYDPDTGILQWKHRPRRHFPSLKEWKRWNARFAGTLAGHKQRHSSITFANGGYLTHRIIWKWMTGKEPPPNIDHESRDGCDNRWINLRPADQTQQNWNKSLQKNNTSGHRGVSPANGKWRAVIYVRKSQRHLGTFSTVEMAIAAYKTAARELHGEFYYE